MIHLKDYKQHEVNFQLLDTQYHWGDTFIAGWVPIISQVFDQQATFTVVAQCGATSNASANFTAARDFVDLANVLWNWIDCNMSTGQSNGNECQGSAPPDFPSECGCCAEGGLAKEFNKLTGYHASGWGTNGEGGSDVFSVTTPLIHGWVLYSTSADWSWQIGDVSKASMDPNTTSEPGTTLSPILGVDWYVGNCGAVFYEGHMIITGPLGVPFWPF